MDKKNIYLDGEYYQNNPTFDIEHSSWKVAHILKLMSKYNLQVNTISEIGCGSGGILLELSKHLHGKTFRGYDISPDAIAMSNKIAKDNLTFKQCTVDKIPDVSDLMLCIDVFEHVEDQYEFLRTLKTKGKHVIFHIPLEIAVWNVLRVKSFSVVRSTVGHINYYLAETALALLEDCGYKIIDVKYTRSVIELPYKKRLNLRILNVLRRMTELFGIARSARIWGGYSLLVLAE